MNISLDYFSTSLLIGGFVALLSGFVVFVHNHRTIENIAWFLFNLMSAVWSFGYFATINATSRESAFIYDWILHLAATLVPLFCLLSVISITKNYKKHQLGMIIASLSGLFFLISTPTKLFVKDVIPKADFNFVPDAGPLYIYFTVYFFVLVLYVLYILYITYKETKNPMEAKRFKYMFIFTAIGSIGGGSVFFLTFNVLFLPYPLILFSLFPVMSIYAILRLQLFNVKVLATEAIIFILWIFIFMRTLLSSSGEDRIVNFGLLVFLVFVGILLIRSVIKEVEQREQIQKLADDLKLANQGQASLMHFMNHQVKGRLGNIKNIFAELLTDDYGTMPPDSKPLLRKGLDEADIGVNYVQNILKGASAENGTLPYDMKPMDLQKLIREVFEKQKFRAEDKSLQYTLDVQDGEYSITGDYVQLGESLRNLIENSINYTHQGQVVVDLSIKQNSFLIKISDTGVGLSPSDKEKLFKAGGRGDESLKVNINSTGYGLVFVKGVIEAHKGKVWAESEGRGKGSVFMIELPKNNGTRTSLG